MRQPDAACAVRWLMEQPACLYTGFFAAVDVGRGAAAVRFAGREGGSARCSREANMRENSPMRRILGSADTKAPRARAAETDL